jgi:hypothetical protein
MGGHEVYTGPLIEVPTVEDLSDVDTFGMVLDDYEATVRFHMGLDLPDAVRKDILGTVIPALRADLALTKITVKDRKALIKAVEFINKLGKTDGGKPQAPSISDLDPIPGQVFQAFVIRHVPTGLYLPQKSTTYGINFEGARLGDGTPNTPDDFLVTAERAKIWPSLEAVKKVFRLAWPSQWDPGVGKYVKWDAGRFSWDYVVVTSDGRTLPVNVLMGTGGNPGTPINRPQLSED